jgi:hypothetical protein
MKTLDQLLATAIESAIALVLALAGCGDNRAAPDGPLPSCASVGCGDEPLYCTRTDRCSCPQPNGERVECQNHEPTPAVDAAVIDADKHDASGINDPRIDAAP